MPKFRVSVTRTTYDMLDFVVEADNEEQAEANAEIEASNHDWGTGNNAEYEVEHTEVVEE